MQKVRQISHVAMFMALMLFFSISQNTVGAQSSQQITITETQLNAILHKIANANIFSVINVEGKRYFSKDFAVRNGYLSLNLGTLDEQNQFFFYYVAITPTVTNGRITCTITHLIAGQMFFTAKQLDQQNPYIKTRNVDQLCDQVFSPFLNGYGSSTQVSGIALYGPPRSNAVQIGLVGRLDPNAPEPAIVAGCQVRTDFFGSQNVRSGPGANYPVLGIMSWPTWYPYLRFENDWVAFKYGDKVGWAYKYSVDGNAECAVVSGQCLWSRGLSYPYCG